MNRLRTLREAQALRLEDVAAKADVSMYYLRKLEDAKHTPGLEIARRLAAALGVTVDEAFPAAGATSGPEAA